MKKKIGVIFGGLSSEHGISLQSAYGVISNLDREKYDVISLGITREGQWFSYHGNVENIGNDTWYRDEENLVPAIISPDRRLKGIIEFHQEGNKYISLDAVFPVLHGRYGEDGTVQGLVELAGIPLVGCEALSSALAMDKYRAHKVVGAAGISIPKNFVIDRETKEVEILQLVEELTYPIFVKPVKEGSSYGITKLHDKKDLMKAVKFAFQFDNEVIIEENIEGIEVGCAILGNRDLIMGSVDEIELLSDFLDYEDKYSNRKSIVHIPGRIDKNTEGRIKEAGEIIYRALGCQGFARIDMFLTPKKEIIFNEVNTIPGFTPISRYPRMMQGINLSFKELLDKLIDLGVGK